MPGEHPGQVPYSGLCLLKLSYLSCPNDRHPHLIDLNLPSGTLWSCCNVDTDHPKKQSPINYGGYYAWGETETKATYVLNNYTHYDQSSHNYVNLSDEIAGTQYDVAHVKWGGSWVMPSRTQIIELLDNCTYEWTTLNGVKGAKFTSKTNGASIFLPATGYRNEDGLYVAGLNGVYWSSTLSSSSLAFSYGYYFSSDNTVESNSGLGFGYAVRPVVRK